MKAFLEFFLTVAIFLAAFIVERKDCKKHPPFIEKGEIGKKKRECYIVSVWNIVGRGSYYCQYYFVKRKNGKYRLKFWSLCSAWGWIWGVLFLAFYIEMLREFPDFGKLSSIGLFLELLSFWALGNLNLIRARMFFHKYMKTQTKGKRR